MERSTRHHQFNAQNRIVGYRLLSAAGGHHCAEHQEEHDRCKHADAANADDYGQYLLQKTFHLRGEREKEGSCDKKKSIPSERLLKEMRDDPYGSARQAMFSREMGSSLSKEGTLIIYKG